MPGVCGIEAGGSDRSVAGAASGRAAGCVYRRAAIRVGGSRGMVLVFLIPNRIE